MNEIIKEVVDIQFWVIFGFGVIGLIILAIYLRHKISGDLGDIIYKQYNNMFEKIDAYTTQYLEANRKLDQLSSNYYQQEGKIAQLEERAIENKENIEKILNAISKIKPC